MDTAWIGFIGAGLGVAGTLLATGLTQWRAEIQRGKDREVEVERLKIDHAAEADRWDRDRRAARQDAQRDYWESLRRDAYREFIQSVLVWRDAITRAGVGRRVLEGLPKEVREALLKEGQSARPGSEQSTIITESMQDSLPEHTPADNAEMELVLVASYEIREQARRVMSRHKEAWRVTCDSNASIGDKDAALERAGTAYLAFLEMARIELGIVQSDDLARVHERVKRSQPQESERIVAKQSAHGTPGEFRC